MKLLVISHSCATAQNQQLYAEIRRQTGWEVTIVVPARWKDEFGNVLDEAPWPGLDGAVRKVPVWANGRIVLHGYRLDWRRFLTEMRPDVIYVNHEPYAVATGQVVAANRATLRRPIGFYSCQNLAKRYPFPFSAVERMVYRECAFAFPITAAVSNVLAHKGFAGERIESPLALDPERYHPGLRETPPPDLPAIPDGGLRIGFVGRLVESKGLRTLARALGDIPDLPWQLILVGRGEFEDRFRDLAREGGYLDRVRFPGYVPHTETPRWLAALDVLVLPSETQPNWSEQFGRVIPEALACGVPVVGSDSGEIPNLIRASGGGLVFPERDAAALAGALRTLLTDAEMRRGCAETGREWVRREVALPSVAARMAETIGRSVREQEGWSGGGSKRSEHIGERWGQFGILTKFVSLHALVQIVAVVTGLIVVRQMDKTQYGWYTLVFGLQASVSALSRFAVAGGILAMGGERIGNRERFGAVMGAARSQRWRILGLSLPLLVPVYAWLLWRNGCPGWMVGGLLGALILNLVVLVEEQIEAAPFALAGRYHVPQWYEFGAFSIRLLLVIGLLLAGWFHPVLLILASAAALAAGLFGYLKPEGRQFGTRDRAAEPDAALVRRFRAYGLNGVPTMVNTMIQSQIGLLLIALFGSTETVADLGAIGKMILLFGIPMAVVDRIFVARLAVERDPERLKQRWRHGIAFAALAGAGIVGLVAATGPQLVWLLGDSYFNLEDDLVWYAVGQAFVLVAAAAFGLLPARGWMRHSWITPLTVLGAQALVFPWIDAGTVRGMILLKLAGDVAGSLHAAVLLKRGFSGKGTL